MKILITGANGMVARAAVEHCVQIGDEVVAMTRQELDIADGSAVAECLGSQEPGAVLNCAAFTDVDGAEANPEAARDANTIGVRNLAEAANRTGARFVTISTDYVFDGSNTGFYTENDSPNPRGVYAETKYEGELAAAEANPGSVIVRSGWIYGRGGTNFLSVMHRLLGEGKNIKAIADAYGTPTFANDLAMRLRELAGRSESGIFHITNSGAGTSYLGFAEKVCELGGFDKGLIEPVSNGDLKRPAPRPVSSKLASSRIEKIGLAPLQNWEAALAKFLRAEGGN
ncbi:MAG TPA: dTDP-4-dehydrorhamnose reductase [Pyrinomonadaceae bacterium]|nr:dTDP-4-dehydrorhamnose reductase [Pyrinomonadaceae bacterium]